MTMCHCLTYPLPETGQRFVCWPFFLGDVMENIVIDPGQFDENELQEIVELFVLASVEMIADGEDAGLVTTAMAIALRMLLEEYGEKERLH